jgi:hypothetical protein
MKTKLRLVPLLVLIFLSGLAIAQSPAGFPPSTKWKQINTDTVRVIFTKGAEDEANRIVTLIQKAASDSPYSLGNRFRKVNILLHSRTTLANGFVALAPFRSEFYLVPASNPLEFGNLPWHENLALHEYHHVQQYNNFRHGLSKGFYYLFGEGGLALANALSVPDWFFEGDAVHSETALSKSGRGRLSLFLSGYNSLWMEGKNYSWMKLRNGSLRDYVPDHYHLGYLLVNYGYLKYGDEFWKNVTSDASAFRGLFYPFQHAVKKYAGVNYKTFRKNALDYYRTQLPAEGEKPVQKIKTVTSYYFPQYIAADSMLYFKTAYNKIPAFYIRTKDGEQRVALQSISNEEWFSYRNHKIAYTAYSTEARWSLIDYSDIVVLDINTRSEKRITRKEKYFTPDFSPDATSIIAVRVNDSLQTELVVVRADDGKVLRTISSQRGYFYSNPRFVNPTTIVVGTKTQDEKMAMQLHHLDTDSWELVVPFSYYSVGLPFVSGDDIYFTANFMNNDDVYVIHLKDKSIFRLTNGVTGNYYPSVFNDTLVWSRFTAEGLMLQTKALQPGEPMNPSRIAGLPGIFAVALPMDISTTPSERFGIKRYKKSTGLFNFHSWRPDYIDPEFTFSLYSDNILGTFSNEFFYRYNQNERSHGLGWNGSYSALFPVLNAGFEYTYNRHLETTVGTITLDQYEARVGYNIPLNLTRGRTFRFLNFGSNFVFNHAIPTGITKDSLIGGSVYYLHHFISWSHYLPRAVQHIFPRFGYVLSAAHRHLLDRKGYQFIGNASVFLPSFGNHSIVLSGSFQQRDQYSLIFANRFAGSRGYSEYDSARMWRVSANYHFPIAYPDFGIANIVYLQRLRGNVFFDYSRLYPVEGTMNTNLRSVGGELYFDTKWWNQLPVSFGIRVSHLLDDGPSPLDKKGSNWVEFILPVNLIQ